MTGLIDALYKRVLLAAHPVGSVYQSTVSTNPATLFGGTWVQIEGRFLLAAGGGYAAGSTGGEAAHTLTAAELPSSGMKIGLCTGGSKQGSGFLYETTYTCRTYDDIFGEFVVGGDQPHNNMPPYYAVYMWRRTA